MNAASLFACTNKSRIVSLRDIVVVGGRSRRSRLKKAGGIENEWCTNGPLSETGGQRQRTGRNWCRFPSRLDRRRWTDIASWCSCLWSLPTREVGLRENTGILPGRWLHSSFRRCCLRVRMYAGTQTDAGDELSNHLAKRPASRDRIHILLSILHEKINRQVDSSLT